MLKIGKWTTAERLTDIIHQSCTDRFVQFLTREIGVTSVHLILDNQRQLLLASVYFAFFIGISVVT